LALPLVVRVDFLELHAVELSLREFFGQSSHLTAQLLKKLPQV
jgi:hypothetical protein